MKANPINQLFSAKKGKSEGTSAAKSPSGKSDFNSLLNSINKNQKQLQNSVKSEIPVNKGSIKELLTKQSQAETNIAADKLPTPKDIKSTSLFTVSKEEKVQSPIDQKTTTQNPLMKNSLKIGVPKEQIMAVDEKTHMPSPKLVNQKYVKQDDGHIISNNKKTLEMPDKLSTDQSKKPAGLVNPMAKNFKVDEKSIFKTPTIDQRVVETRAQNVINEQTNVRNNFFQNSQAPREVMSNYKQGQNLFDDKIVNSKNIQQSGGMIPDRAFDKLAKKDQKEDFADRNENLLNQQSLRLGTKLDLAPANQKMVLDMGQINTSNSDKIIEQVSNYITQTNFANKQSLDVTVRHQDLGQFNIHVQKNVGHHEMALKIVADSKAGHDFFTQNQSQLMSKLQSSGLSISEMKVSQTFDSNSFDKNGNSSFGSNLGGRDNGYYSQNSKDQAQQDSERRRNLWEDFQQRYEA